MEIITVKCKECGYVHPLVKGQCPAAKRQQVLQDCQNEKIQQFITDLIKHLQSSQHSENKMNTIRNMFKF